MLHLLEHRPHSQARRFGELLLSLWTERAAMPLTWLGQGYIVIFMASVRSLFLKPHVVHAACACGEGSLLHDAGDLVHVMLLDGAVSVRSKLVSAA
ncbi:hypothetical protein AMTR_s00006p00065810 [Amborella trichopoda]|uniref:Uncharacterized protein n=1 Tax=Amborella trichopoda TaxID=13333 RepID=W1PCD6_AMBTC|nr:hypothetical protein AMTR_s00006p00065810 [Amborella trichopoda]